MNTKHVYIYIVYMSICINKSMYISICMYICRIPSIHEYT